MRLIDADALIETGIRVRDGMISDDHLIYVPMRDVMNSIDKAPTIEAKPVKHGRWIKMTGMMPPEYHGHYECSECHWHMKGIRSSWTREEELTYCPNCGARMDGGEENE